MEYKEVHVSAKYVIIKTVLSELLFNSVNSVEEFPGASLGRLITINSVLNGAT